ncbi:extracellular solute-binding protein family 1 [Catenulispora acidiphila DSM 44928]|uniref:Extracellular solute-binding protein family 1 n=1 Tax=Catenulispora acidiphila (strain DSM 44928 / JCM 14897 / NBRC 102108 / NRRL B-24433 / ID139908) TaxID=479433 RepID=C7PZP3_CATAD|nr:ABC transporter substrate-binding protein [Catenulispora acidiphila]ACU73558.1 extracellular solute-binding protein family 1 [Catenulispora acidiphila DSM 44928]
MHPRTARTLRSAAAAATTAVLALTAACSSSASSSSKAPADPTKPVTITVWTGQDVNPEKLLEGLAKQFHAAHPNVTVDISPGAPTTDQLLPKLIAAFTSGTYPDISYNFGSWATQMQLSGRTLDITDKVKDPAVKWDEFPPAARQTATPNGHVIGFPAVVDNLALMYNKKLFQAAGLSEPTNTWTWDDFRAAAKKLTDPAKNVYGTAYSVSGTEDTTWHFWPLLWQKGGTVLNSDNSKAAFDSDAGVAALTFLQQMAVTDKSVYLSQDDQKYADLFKSGLIGMIMSGPWQLSDNVGANLDYGVTYLPSFDGTSHQTISGPDLWTLYDHHDANRTYWSYQFAQWLTSAQTDPQFNLATGNLPLRSSEAGSQEFQDYAKQYPGAQTLFDNLKNATTARPTVPGYVGLSQAVGQAIAKVLQGQGDPKSALQDAAKAADVALAQAD